MKLTVEIIMVFYWASLIVACICVSVFLVVEERILVGTNLKTILHNLLEYLKFWKPIKRYHWFYVDGSLRMEKYMLRGELHNPVGPAFIMYDVYGDIISLYYHLSGREIRPTGTYNKSSGVIESCEKELEKYRNRRSIKESKLGKGLY